MENFLSPSPIGLGLMSGTSLDGLDMALCQFSFENNTWKYKIISCKTAEYEESFRQRLKEADTLDGLGLVELDRAFAAHIGQQVSQFDYPSPFVVQGGGAGARQTAGGVLNDILSV